MSILELPRPETSPGAFASAQDLFVDSDSRTVFVIAHGPLSAPPGFEDASLRFVDPASAAALIEQEHPASVIADLELLSRTPCGIELRRSLDALVVQGEVTVTWVRSD